MSLGKILDSEPLAVDIQLLGSELRLFILVLVLQVEQIVQSFLGTRFADPSSVGLKTVYQPSLPCALTIGTGGGNAPQSTRHLSSMRA